MEYKIVEFDEILYQGYHVKVDLNNVKKLILRAYGTKFLMNQRNQLQKTMIIL